MKKKMTIAIFFLSMILVISGCFTSRKPAVSFDGIRYKFGKALEGTKIVFTFMFSNTGTIDLVIEELEISCECIIVREYDKTVKPGKKGKIYGVIDTKGFEGKVVKAIKVTTNVPGTEPVVLTMEGEIVPGQE